MAGKHSVATGVAHGAVQIAPDGTALAPIRKIIPFSAVDGVGNRTAIFLQGCNLDCKYCHNPETRAMADPAATWQTPAQAFAQVQRQVPFIRGVTVSGGECMLYPAFVRDLFALCKGVGLGTLIDSNGTIPFADLPDLLAVTDGVMLDVKAFAPADALAVTGAGNATVLQNARFLAQQGKLAELRTVVVPSLCDAAEVVAGIADYLTAQGIGGAVPLQTLRYKLIAYRPQGVRAAYRNMAQPTPAQMQTLAALATSKGFGEVVVL